MSGQLVWWASHHPSFLPGSQTLVSLPHRGPPYPISCGLGPRIPHSPVLLEAVGGRDHPAVSDERPPADVPAPNLEAGLPGPLALGRHGTAHYAARGALQATVWVCAQGQPEASEKQTVRAGEGEAQRAAEGRWGERQEKE